MTTDKVIELAILNDRGAAGDALSRRPAAIRETIQAGVYHRAMLDATALDIAFRAGWLGKDDSDEAKWRLEAGLWLMRTYERAGLRPRESGSYQTRSEGTPEMSDVEAWNQKVYADTARVIGPSDWPMLRAFLIDSANPPPAARPEICRQLDRLACHRGIMPSTHPEYPRIAATLRNDGVAAWR